MIKSSRFSYNALCIYLFYAFCTSVYASPAAIDYLKDDLSFAQYNALNLIEFESDINGAKWALKNNNGTSTREGDILTLVYPTSIFQTVSLVANEKYILTFSGAGADYDIARLRVINSVTRDLITYEYLSLRADSYTYSLSFTAPETALYDIEIISLPDSGDLIIDWGMMGVFLESELLAAGATWSDFGVWADSMGINWPAQLKARFGVPDYIDGAVGGESSSEILARALNADNLGDIVIIWAGNNNALDLATVSSDIWQIISLIPHDKFVVLSLHNNAAFDNTTPTYSSVISINDYLSNSFGDKYIDTRSFLISQADVNDVDDIADVSSGIVPRSLRSDGIHLNAAGRNFVADYVMFRINLLYNTPQPADVPKNDPLPDEPPLINEEPLVNVETPSSSSRISSLGIFFFPIIACCLFSRMLSGFRFDFNYYVKRLASS